MTKFEQVLLPIAELLGRKNTDYGNNYDELREEFGSVSFQLRVKDKLNRIKNLDKHEVDVNYESIEDNINDIIGYCTLELLYRKEGAVNE